MATVGRVPAYDALRGVVNLLQPATNYYPTSMVRPDLTAGYEPNKSHVVEKG